MLELTRVDGEIIAEYEDEYSIKYTVERNKRNLQNVWLTNTNLSSIDLSGADLSGANLSGANLVSARLNNANLYGACLMNANMHGAWLFGASLSYANLISAHLENSNLRNTDLSYTTLCYANLCHADLSGANLYRSNLSMANLYNADLSYTYLGETGLSETNLKNAKLYNASAFHPKHICSLLFLYDQPGKIRLYKLVNNDGSPVNSYENMNYLEKDVFITGNADIDPFSRVGVGINVETLDLCIRQWRMGMRILIMEFKAKDIACIPYTTDGKIRLHRCKRVGEVDLVECGLTKKPEEI